jgi:rhamnosyl/mannosyltransferase
MRIKVLHVGKFYPPFHGGMENHLQALCTELRHYVDLRVLVSNTGRATSHEVLDNVPVTRVGTWSRFASASLSPALAAEIRSAEADIVHLHWPNPTAVLAFLASRHPGRLVVTYHSDVVRQRRLGAIFEPILHYTLKRASAIIVTSPNYMESSRILRRHAGRCCVIPLGIPAQFFCRPNAGAVRAIRNEHGERIVLTVGRLVSYKGTEHLIRAMKNVSARLLIAGSGPLRTSLQDLVARLDLASKVVFVGSPSTESLLDYYRASDLFVMPSTERSEAFGIAQIEAMAACRPVVNTKLDSGVPYVSQHEKTGFTVPPRDADALARAINQLLDDTDLRLRYGKAALQRAETMFTAETMAKRTLRLYEAVLENRQVEPDLLDPTSVSTACAEGPSPKEGMLTSLRQPKRKKSAVR